MSDPILRVSDTAFMAAAYRAQESARPDALFRDPLADRLAGERGRAMVAHLPKRAVVGGWTVVMRTHIIDDMIRCAVAQGVDTVLNLGAGLDTRPYRLDLPPALQWVEVDAPQVIEAKASLLADEPAHCQVQRIAADLAQTSQRQACLQAALGGAKQALVLTEAVTPYLSESAVADLAQDLRAQGAVGAWINDYFSPEAYSYRRRSGMSQAMQNAPFLFEPADYFGFFAQQGWRAQETRYFAEQGQRLGRVAPFPWGVRVMTTLLQALAGRQRREAMQRCAGITHLVPDVSADGASKSA